MIRKALTRRTFVAVLGSVLGGLLVPAALDARTAGQRAQSRQRKLGLHMFRWSGSGRRASRAALAHAANRRYALKWAAMRDLPHPGAHLKLVRLDVSVSEYFRLFVSRRRLKIDLRQLH